MKLDQAQVDAQSLNIAYCHIVSPVTGRIGLRLVDPGNYVQTTTASSIAVVTQMQPITVIFSVPEDDLPEIMPQLAAGTTLQVTAFDRANVKQLAVGKVAAVDNQIDTTTGTVKVRAQFDNTDDALFPNQFVNAQLLVRHAAKRRHRADGGDPARLAGRPARHLRLRDQRRRHRRGAADHHRPDRRQHDRGRIPGSPPANASWSTAPTGCATACRSTSPRSTASRSARPAPRPGRPAPAEAAPAAEAVAAKIVRRTGATRSQ